MRIDKQARGKTRKKYGRSVRRLAALIRWGSVVLGVLLGLMIVLGSAAFSLLSVEGMTQEIISQLPDEVSVGIIGGADGPTSIMIPEAAEAATAAGAVGGIVAGVLVALIYIVIGWLGSSALYGFAEMIYCQEEIVAQNTKQIKLLEQIAGTAGYDEE